ncbi:GerAB/ArcD/ProY family transporter [Bacillus sp. S/N-304-OC-R1]|uniref:GerAB/ArcD/ProY family transporter n=1 Tax=Bacillus sp. S/N-304-OC-R1 TaxID=2758034 RepID=UPI001C8D0FB2|nr:GerAB/ArcD/ProY family transporter [Bacillus sp. S/N-304-OC-R1]MBY0124185.1 GerAB/ArcD/ProY family transporter [Bacillus sp. S/N-304-OC-R1]
MQEVIPDRFKIAPFLVFYMVVSMQIGIGTLGYQRIIAKYTSQDSWISVLLAGLSLHIIIWLIYKIAETVNGDIVTAHAFVFGKVLGKIISSFFILYFLFMSLTVLRTYIEIIQVWVFPSMSVFWYTLAYMILCIYIIYGGFKVVVGIAFFGAILPSYLFLIFIYDLKFTEFEHLLPIFDHSIMDLLTGSFHMSLSLIGFEIVLFIYPFIKEPQKSKKWAHFAILSTTMIYTGLMVLTIAYFSNEQLQKAIWATLTMWKIVEMPFVERFEYIGIASWSLVILPNVCIPIWVASRLLKRIYHLKQKKGVLFISAAIIGVINIFNTRERVGILNDYLGKTGFAITFIYIPLLFIAILIAKKVKKK